MRAGTRRTKHTRARAPLTAVTAAGHATRDRLIMLRHADSLELPAVRDHARPISKQGRVAAQQLAALLADRGWVPDLIICSSAMRTRQTLEAMCERVSEFVVAPAQFLASLYAVTALDGHTQRHLCEVMLDAAPDAAHCVMCVGHNKGMEVSEEEGVRATPAHRRCAPSRASAAWRGISRGWKWRPQAGGARGVPTPGGGHGPPGVPTRVAHRRLRLPRPRPLSVLCRRLRHRLR